jgi:hypothetical protein
MRNKVPPNEKHKTISGAPIRNSYEDFGRILPHCDQFPVSQLSTWRKESKNNPNIFKLFEKYNVLILEATFYITWQEALDDWINHTNRSGGRGDQKIIIYTGAIDRWLKHLGACEIEKMTNEKQIRRKIGSCSKAIKRSFDVLQKVDIIGAMNEIDVPFWSGMFPSANVYWMPCIVPVDAYKKRFKPLDKRDQNRVNLCVHSDLLLPAHARRGDIMSFAVYRNLKKQHPNLKAFSYMQRSHGRVIDETYILLKKLGCENVRLMSHQREWAEISSLGWFGLNLMSSRVQGRWQTFHAAAGIPMIASEEISAQKKCFPDLAIPWSDLVQAEELANELMTNRGFYEQVVETAQKEVEWFGPEIQRERLMAAIKGETIDSILSSKEEDKAHPDIPLTDKTTGETIGRMVHVSWEALTVAELREMAKIPRFNIEKPYKLNKEQLIEALTERLSGMKKPASSTDSPETGE